MSRRRGRHRSRFEDSTAAFDRFVADSGDALFRLAVILSADVRAGEDLYQETLQRLASRWDTVDNPTAWSRRVMHNLSVDRFRSARSRPTEVLSSESGRALSDPTSADRLNSVELRPALFQAMGDLTDTQRLVVALRFLEDRSEGEVAEMLSVPVGTIKSTTSRAVGRLRRHPSLLHLFPDPTYPSDEAAG